MKTQYPIICILLMLTIAILSMSRIVAGQPIDYDKPLTRLAFGSCNRQNLDQPIWQAVVDAKPDLWMWGGDNIYGDTANMNLLAERYDVQRKHPDYQKIRAQMPIVGIWDDHDYGRNDGGEEYSKKEESQQLLLDFLDEPNDSQRRVQQGAYVAYTLGPIGQQVKLIILDTRYHRQQPGVNKDLLGETQWAWLEAKLTASTADIHIIYSSIQVLVKQNLRGEQWANFPSARRRLLSLAKHSQAKGLIFLSGDKHFGVIEQVRVKEKLFTEMMASGLTHTISGWQKNLAQMYYSGQVMTKLNFGMLEIDWAKSELTLSLRGVANKVHLQKRLIFR